MKRIEIQQGNVVEREQLSQLKPGISREQVRFLLGNPLVNNAFSDEQWFYPFYLRDDTGASKAFRLTISFVDDTYVGHEVDGEFFDIKRQQNP